MNVIQCSLLSSLKRTSALFIEDTMIGKKHTLKHSMHSNTHNQHASGHAYTQYYHNPVDCMTSEIHVFNFLIDVPRWF